MSTTEVSSQTSSETSPVEPGQMKLEVVVLPVSDVDRAKAFSFAPFSDPDGNEWLLQEIKTRLPGR